MSARPGASAKAIQATGPGVGRTVLDELLDLLDRPAWQADALCIEYPEVNFFPARGESAEPARAVCARCLVRAECFAWALEHGEGPDSAGGHGVWGGTSARERRRLDSQRRGGGARTGRRVNASSGRGQEAGEIRKV